VLGGSSVEFLLRSVSVSSLVLGEPLYSNWLINYLRLLLVINPDFTFRRVVCN
jgi:hypothetical protein